MTASVFSSCAGTGAVAAVCIQDGASAARASSWRNAQKRRDRSPHSKSAKNAILEWSTLEQFSSILVAGGAGAGLQHDLFFIGGPHNLKDFAQRCVVLRG